MSNLSRFVGSYAIAAGVELPLNGKVDLSLSKINRYVSFQAANNIVNLSVANTSTNTYLNIEGMGPVQVSTGNLTGTSGVQIQWPLNVPQVLTDSSIPQGVWTPIDGGSTVKYGRILNLPGSDYRASLVLSPTAVLIVTMDNGSGFFSNVYFTVYNPVTRTLGATTTYALPVRDLYGIIIQLFATSTTTCFVGFAHPSTNPEIGTGCAILSISGSSVSVTYSSISVDGQSNEYPSYGNTNSLNSLFVQLSNSLAVCIKPGSVNGQNNTSIIGVNSLTGAVGATYSELGNSGYVGMFFGAYKLTTTSFVLYNIYSNTLNCVIYSLSGLTVTRSAVYQVSGFTPSSSGVYDVGGNQHILINSSGASSQAVAILNGVPGTPVSNPYTTLGNFNSDLMGIFRTDAYKIAPPYPYVSWLGSSYPIGGVGVIVTGKSLVVGFTTGSPMLLTVSGSTTLTWSSSPVNLLATDGSSMAWKSLSGSMYYYDSNLQGVRTLSVSGSSLVVGGSNLFTVPGSFQSLSPVNLYSHYAITDNLLGGFYKLPSGSYVPYPLNQLNSTDNTTKGYLQTVLTSDGQAIVVQNPNIAAQPLYLIDGIQ